MPGLPIGQAVLGASRAHLYLNAFVVMTVKVIWLYLWSHETAMGVTRMADTASVPIRKLLAGYSGVVRLIWRSPGTLFALAIGVIAAAVSAVATTFWPVLVQNKLLVPDPLLPIFAMGRSVVAIVFLFTVAPRLTRTTHLKGALLVGLFAYAAGQLLVASISTPSGAGVSASTYVLLGGQWLVFCFLGFFSQLSLDSLVG